VKKVFSISFLLLMLTTTLRLTVATHYCSGHIAALKVSLSGKLASCGMAECTENNSNITESHISKHCCNDVIKFCGTDSNYDPSFTVIPDFNQYNSDIFNIPAGLPLLPSASLKSLDINVRPPGILMSSSVDLTDICIFRI